METENLDLGAKCTIIRAEELHKQMEDLLQTGHDVEVDVSQIEQIDTSVLQLLLSFHQTLSQDGRTLSWKSPSEQTLATAKLLGLDSPLGLTQH
jgi:anti-anti-sigma regulatory factor